MSLGDARIRHPHQTFAQEHSRGRNTRSFRQRSGKVDTNNEVRIGVRCSDGTIVWALTDSEAEAIRKQELKNAAVERMDRKLRLQKIVAAQSAEIDHW